MLVVLADTGATDPIAQLSAGTSLVVALLALLFAYLAFGAWRKRRSPPLRWVSAAFAVFAAKNVFSAVNVLTHLVEHDVIELALSLFDLLILVLLFVPFLRRKRAA